MRLLQQPPGLRAAMWARARRTLARTSALDSSLAGLLDSSQGLLETRPFRSPHHSCSAAGLLGGGGLPRPGELALAHHGVLFLDELAEFRRAVLDQLRQPLEDGEVWIHRARQRTRFPCQITLVAATNPCPCGWLGDPERSCSCGEGQRQRYWGRLSGPLLDRIDLQVVMRRPSSHALTAPFRQHSDGDGPESTAVVRQRVLRARRRMAGRNPAGCSNGRIPGGVLHQVVQLEPQALLVWEGALRQRQLSARAGARLLRVAQTISDLGAQSQISAAAIAEALTYRSFDQLH